MAKKIPVDFTLSEARQERGKTYIHLLIYIGLAAGILAVYEPIRKNGFVSYDDMAYVVDNPNVNSGITLQSVIWAFTKPYLGNWYPLTWLSHMLDFEIYGSNPAGHHITSVLIHTAASLLLFRVLLRMTGALWPSAFVAAIFALHPLHVESVAWASERKDVLSAFFWILTMLAYGWYTERTTVRRYLLMLAVFFMGLMSKPMVVTLPFVLLLLDYWPLERIRRSGETLSAKWLILEKVPLFVLSAMVSMTTFFAQQTAGAINTLETVPLDYRIANMFVSYIGYIHKTLWPAGLAVIYPLTQAISSKSTLIICVVLFLTITVLSITIGRRRKYMAVGWLWYVGTLIPVIGLVQVGSQSMADRYLYIPMVGLLIIVAWGIKDLVANRFRWRIIISVLTGLILACTVVLTRIQVRYWQNSLTLFEHALAVTRENKVAEHSYGCALWKAGRLDEAVTHLKNALRISPKSFDICNNLGKVLLEHRKYNEAIVCFNELIGSQKQQIPPDVYANLGTAQMQTGNYKLAIQNWTRTIQMDPDNSDILNNLAWVLAVSSDDSVRNIDRAIELSRQACELTKYQEANPLDTLAAAYAAKGMFDKAVMTAQQAIDAARTGNHKQLVSEIQKRLELYQAGRPYIEK